MKWKRYVHNFWLHLLPSLSNQALDCRVATQCRHPCRPLVFVLQLMKRAKGLYKLKMLNKQTRVY